MKKYSSYKDSSVKWLGEIPSHWKVLHLRNLIRIFSEKGFPNAQLLSVTREKGVILRNKDDKEENHNFVPDDLSGYKHLLPGDFIINKMKSWQGSYGVSPYEGIVSPAYYTCKLKGVDKDFFSKAIRSKAYIPFFSQFSKGIRVDQWDLDPSAMKNIPFVLPSIKEQRAIASYISQITEHIDQAIAQQQKMIDLLNERKQIIIQKAVTKGLDPNVEMKDSGDEVIGRIPNQWEIARFKNVAYVKANLVHPNLYLNFPQISPDNIEKNTGKLFGVKTVEECGIISDNHLFHKGQIIYSKIRPTLNKVTLAPYEGLCSADMYPIETTMNNKYLLYYMLSNSFVSQVSFYVMDRVKMPKINRDELGQILVTIPPSAEQKKIVDFIESKLAVISNAVAICFNITALLQERKQIIINDVVTGKIKVSE